MHTTTIQAYKDAVIDVAPLRIGVSALETLFRLWVTLENGAEGDGVFGALRRHTLGGLINELILCFFFLSYALMAGIYARGVPKTTLTNHDYYFPSMTTTRKQWF